MPQKKKEDRRTTPQFYFQLDSIVGSSIYKEDDSNQILNGSNEDVRMINNENQNIEEEHNGNFFDEPGNDQWKVIDDYRSDDGQFEEEQFEDHQIENDIIEDPTNTKKKPKKKKNLSDSEYTPQSQGPKKKKVKNETNKSKNFFSQFSLIIEKISIGNQNLEKLLREQKINMNNLAFLRIPQMNRLIIPYFLNKTLNRSWQLNKNELETKTEAKKQLRLFKKYIKGENTTWVAHN